jgi:hypothetical protein
MMRLTALLLVVLASLSASAQNTSDWIMLFDGKSAAAWRTYNSKTLGAAWKISDGTLTMDTETKEGRGDIITDAEFENFELILEWKIQNCGNSGIFFNVVEDPKYRWVFVTGPEMQILDNTCHEDAKIHKHRSGDLYDLIPCSREVTRPAGEWNEVRIVSQNGSYQFWLNGTNVVNVTMHTPEWDALVQSSKFKNMPAFGKSTKGHIALQDHGDQVWFRNIRIRNL